MALNSIKELRIWCQKVLPLVYDDSLSYYEVLAKVVSKINEVITLAEQQNETIEEALSEIDSFETDISSQFETYKATLEAALDTFEGEITAQQSAFEGRMTDAFADFLADYEREFGITNLYGDSTTLAISQNQVSRLLDYTTNNNRFNPEVITSGKAIDNTGAVIDNPNTAVTGYIEVQPGENIVAQAKNNTTSERYQGAGSGTDVPLVFDSIAGYDEELTFVSGSFKSLVFNYQVPVGVKYIKIAMGQTILDGTNADMSELAIVNSDGTIYPYQPYSEQNAIVKMNALPVDDTQVGNHLWSANKINAFQAAVEAEIGQLETDLTGTVQGAIGDMNTAFTQKSAELDTKFDTLEGSIQAEQEAFETEIEGALASQKTELETEIGEVASDVQTLSGSVTTQGQAITNLTGIVTNVEGRVDTLETDMAAAKEDISDLEASDAQHTSDITNLIDRVYEAENNIDTLETASEEHTTAISNLQAKDAELVADINGLTTRVGAAEGDIDLLEGRADAIEDDLVDIGTDVIALEENKADKVGYEKDLNVGGAHMLIGNGTISDNKAYNFRRTADGNQNVGNRLTDEIIGGTLVVNQLVQNGNFADGISGWSPFRGTISAANNVLTYVRDSTEGVVGEIITTLPELKADHKYLLLATIYSAKAINSGFSINNASTSIKPIEANKKTTIGTLVNIETPSTTAFSVYTDRSQALSEGDIVTVENVQVIDITQMLTSSSIANYVYNLEQTTAGTGLAWLYEYFPILNGGYIPFNTGTLQSIVLSKHKLTGFNQWNEEWEVGAYDTSTGEKIYTGRQIRSKNKIAVKPSTTYYCKGGAGTDVAPWAGFFDINGNIIEGWRTGTTTSRNFSQILNTEFITPPNCYSMVFYVSAGYGLTYNNDICINFSDERNGEYEPHIIHEYTLNSSKELRGVPKIDSNGKLYFDGDRYKGDVTRKWYVTNFTERNWSSDAANDNGIIRFAITTSSTTPPEKASGKSNISSSLFEAYTGSASALPISTDQELVSGNDSGSQVYVSIKASRLNGDLTTSAGRSTAFKTWITNNNFLIMYELAEPTMEEATPVPNPQICSPYGTEEYIDPRVEAGTIPFAIPTGHETVYNTSLDYKLNALPEFPTEAGTYKLQVTVSAGVVTRSWIAEA